MSVSFFFSSLIEIDVQFFLVMSFGKRRKSNAVVVEVKSCVVFAHEGVSQNPKGTGSGINIKTHKGWETLSLSLIFDDQNIVLLRLKSK